jgi:hypothetical protein
MDDLIQPVEPTRIENIIGHFKMGAGAPTYTPKGFWDSLYLNTTTGALSTYDFTNSAWKNWVISLWGLCIRKRRRHTLPERMDGREKQHGQLHHHAQSRHDELYPSGVGSRE